MAIDLFGSISCSGQQASLPPQRICANLCRIIYGAGRVEEGAMNIAILLTNCRCEMMDDFATELLWLG